MGSSTPTFRLQDALGPCWSGELGDLDRWLSRRTDAFRTIEVYIDERAATFLLRGRAPRRALTGKVVVRLDSSRQLDRARAIGEALLVVERWRTPADGPP